MLLKVRSGPIRNGSGVIFEGKWDLNEDLLSLFEKTSCQISPFSVILSTSRYYPVEVFNS